MLSLEDADEEKYQPREKDLDAIGAALSATPEERIEPATGVESPLPTGTLGVGGVKSMLGGDIGLSVDPKLADDISSAGPTKPAKTDYASILAEKPLPSDLGDDAYKKAQQKDRDSYWDTIAFNAAHRAFAGDKPGPDIQAPPSTADDLLKRRALAQQKEDKDRALRLQLAKLMAPKEEKPGKTPEEIDKLKAEAEEQRALAKLHGGEFDRLGSKDGYNSGELERRIAADAERKSYHQQYLDALRRRDAARAAALKAKAAKAGGGRPLPTTALGELADFDVADREIDNLNKTFDKLKMGTGGAKASAKATDILGLQGTDAAEYNAAARRTMQIVGKILEGGKLAEGDERKYSKMLPQAGDSAAVRAQKVEGLRAALKAQKAAKLKEYGAGGYKTPEIERAPLKVRQKSTGITLDATPEELKEIEGDEDFEVLGGP